MVRFIYLLCLIIYIKDIICYDHVPLKRQQVKYLGKHLRKSNKKNIKDSHNIKRRQGNGASNENEQFTQIDVASFIQTPDSFVDDGVLLPQQGYFKGQGMSHYNNYEDLNKNIYTNAKEVNFNVDESEKMKSKHDSFSYNDIGINILNLEESSTISRSDEFEDDDYRRVLENDIGVDDSMRIPQKKCSHEQLKNLKFPFFFHRSNASSKSKISNINTTKKQHFTMDFNDYISFDKDKSLSPKEINVHANKRNTCSKCNNNKKEIKSGNRGLRKSIIHNSRQYYQKFKNESKNKKITTDVNMVNNNQILIKKQDITVENITAHINHSTKSFKQGEKKSFISRKRKANAHTRKKGNKKERYHENPKDNKMLNNAM